MLDADREPAPEVLAALPVFPLPNAVLLPGMVLPLNVFEPQYLALVDYALAHGGHVGVPLARSGPEDTDQAPLEAIFGLGKIVFHQQLPDGRRFIRIEGLGRARMREELDTGGEAPDNETQFRQVSAEPLPEDSPTDASGLEILKAQIERIASTLDADDEDMVRCVLNIPDGRVLVYAITAIIPTLGLLVPEAEGDEEPCPFLRLQQDSLAADTADERIDLLLRHAAAICDALGACGRFPRTMMN